MRKILLTIFLSFSISFLFGQVNSQNNSLEQINKRPLMGWSSWNVYNLDINATKIEKQAKALVDLGLRDLGYQFVNIDDGFWAGRDKNDNLIINRDRFPKGLKPLVDMIKSYHLHPGIYSDAGVMSCGSIWGGDLNGINVGLHGHLEQDAELYFNELGFEYIKIDYCGAGDELNLDTEKQYISLIKGINQISRHPVIVNICRWAYPGNWARGLANAWRISYDITPNWDRIKYIIDKNLYLSAYASSQGFNDMDMLELGMGMTNNEEEVHMGMWSIMSSPLIIGCDLTKINDSSLKLLKNKTLISINQDKLARQAKVVQHKGETYVLVKDIEKIRGNKRAVALYNPSDKKQKITVSLADLGYELQNSKDEIKVFDAIKEYREKSLKNDLSISLEPRSIKVYILEGNRGSKQGNYEAEWAFISNYNDLPKSDRTKAPVYKKDSLASGQMIVGNAGGENNFISWDEVYTEKSGKYIVEIYYRPNPLRTKFFLGVNGAIHSSEFLSKKMDNQEFNKKSIAVNMKKGFNRVKLSSISNLLPDIDRISIYRASE